MKSKSINKDNALDKCRILKYPITTESALKKIECDNTVVFIVDNKANKIQIKDAFYKMFEMKVQKVNTLIGLVIFKIFGKS